MLRAVFLVMLFPATTLGQYDPPQEFVPQTPKAISAPTWRPKATLRGTVADLPAAIDVAPPAELSVSGRNVRPVDFRGAETSNPTIAKQWAAKLVMRPVSTAGQNESLSLLDALKAGPSTRRPELVAAYWLLWKAAADLTIAEQRLALLRPIEAAGDAEDELRWLRAESAALHATAQLALSDAQETMNSMVANRSPLSSWPSDAAWTGTYETRLNEIYATRPAPRTLSRGDRRLPLLQRSVQADAVAADLAWRRVESIQQRYLQGMVPLNELVTGVGHWTHRAKAFVARTHEYNEAIASYALHVGRRVTEAEVIAGMLLPRAGNSLAAEVPLVPVRR